MKMSIGYIPIPAVIFLAHFGRSVLIDPAQTRGGTRWIISIVVGGSIGMSFTTLSLLLFSVMLWRISPTPRRIAERIGIYAGYGATLGAILGVRVVTGEAEHSTVSATFQWDYLDTIGRLATFGTLLGMSVAVVATILSFYRMLKEPVVGIDGWAAAGLIPVPILLGLWSAYWVTGALIRGVGWQ
jgi:hypothetical protein